MIELNGYVFGFWLNCTRFFIKDVLTKLHLSCNLLGKQFMITNKINKFLYIATFVLSESSSSGGLFRRDNTIPLCLISRFSCYLVACELGAFVCAHVFWDLIKVRLFWSTNWVLPNLRLVESIDIRVLFFVHSEEVNYELKLTFSYKFVYRTLSAFLVKLFVSHVDIRLSNTQHDAVACPGINVKLFQQRLCKNPRLTTIEQHRYACCIE